MCLGIDAALKHPDLFEAFDGVSRYVGSLAADRPVMVADRSEAETEHVLAETLAGRERVRDPGPTDGCAEEAPVPVRHG
jgi:hypothetical protein